MEQVEPVQLPYEPRPAPKPIFKKKELRQSNRRRFDMILVFIVVFSMSGFMSPVSTISHWLAVTLWALFMFIFAIELFLMAQRYRLSAGKWMARPGERRILKSNIWLRALRVAPPRDALLQSAAVFQPAAKNLSPKQDQLQSTLVLKFLQAVVFLICLSIICVACVKSLVQNFSQKPISSAFEVILLAAGAVFAVGLAAGLVTACWRRCRPSSNSPFLQSWIEYWGLRVETFEMRRSDKRI